MHKQMNKTPTKPINNQMKPKQTHTKKKKKSNETHIPRAYMDSDLVEIEK